MNLSLRGRMAIWFAIAIPILVFVLAFAAQQVMVVALEESLESSLERHAETVIAAITSNFGAEQENYDDILDTLTEENFLSIPSLLRVANSQGNVVAEFGEIPDPLIDDLDALLVAAELDDRHFDTIDIRGVEALKVITIAVTGPSANRNVAYVQAGETLTSISGARNQLWRFTLLIGIVGSVTAIVVGLFILSRGFRPLERMLRRVQEIERSNLNELLPDEPRPPEIQQLADNLNSMWERLEASFKAREIFVASVSHEIRTPLTALAGQIEVLLMAAIPQMETRESLERMSNEVHRLIRMTNNLLLNAQLETKPALISESVNLRSLIEDIVGQVWVLAEGIDLGLYVHDDLLVSGDQDLIKQLVLNIVDNAIKFTPKGGRVDLILAQKGGWAVLEVSDTGHGIPSEHLPHVMEAFYKSRSQKGAASRGAGLGLAIVKQIVDLHNGEIEIQSQENVGTKVKIRLPIAETFVEEEIILAERVMASDEARG